MQILNGKEAAQAIKDSLKLEVAQHATQGKQVPPFGGCFSRK